MANDLDSPKLDKRKPGSNWGGRRTGAGYKSRDNGLTVNSLKHDVMTYRRKYNVMPLDHMLKVLNSDCPERKNKETLEAFDKRQLRHTARQDWAAEHAAPFMHAKLASIEVTVAEGGAPVKHKVDYTKLSDNELNQLESLVCKASTDDGDVEAEVTLDGSQYHEVNGENNED